MTDNGELKITGVSCNGTVTIITIIFFNQKLMLPMKEKKCLEQLYEVNIVVWFTILGFYTVKIFSCNHIGSLWKKFVLIN